jgi:AmmeMemoRadiSam system protein B/AmmeMemoRadiSam system protein A
MNKVRRAAVAGQFYPDSVTELKSNVDRLLDNARSAAPCPKVLVAPHAGYVYSGAVAAEVYARLRNAKRPIERVVLLGPSHRVAFRGIAASGASAFATPLGEIPLDREATAAIAGLPGVVTREDAHALEHSLEVHLPFLQRSLERFRLVPLVVGDASPEEVAAVIDTLWGGPETLIVVSTDLSHFLPYEEAQARDAATCRLIESREARLTGDQACGCRPLNGLLTLLRRRRLGIETVAAKNSGDTAGGRDRVVGYGAWAVNEAPSADAGGRGPDESATDLLNLAQRQQLLHLARSAISHEFTNAGEFRVPAGHFHSALRAHRASFVTLSTGGRLRGCIGNLAATRPLLADVTHNAGAAAFRDPRFKPLQPEEFPDTELHVSVLGSPVPVAVRSRAALIECLKPGVHGVILEEGERRATYLPSVWKTLPEPDQFLSELRAKAGLSRQGWSPLTQVSVYTTQEFS